MQPGSPAALLLPAVVLSLIKKPVLHSGDEFLRFPRIVRVVGFVASGERHHGAVMEIVVPQRVQAVASFLRRLNQPYLLRFIFRHDNGFSWLRLSPDLARDGAQ